MTSAAGLCQDKLCDDYLAAQCAEGYTGTLCASCLPGYGRSRAYGCSRCKSVPVMAAIYTFGALALMIIIRVMMYLSTNSDRQWTAATLASQPVLPAAAAAAASNGTDAAAAAPASSSHGTRPATVVNGAAMRGAAPPLSVTASQRITPALPSSVLKVMVLYMQYSLMIAGMAIEWPAIVLVPFTALAALWSGASSEAVAVECLVPHSNFGYSVGVLRALMYLCAPVAMYIIILASECIWRACRPWVQAASRHCIAKQASGSGGSVLQLARWHLALNWDCCVATPEHAGRAPQVSGDGDRALDERHSVNDVELAAAAPVALVIPVITDCTVRGLDDSAPTAAWCAVLAMVTVFFFLTSLARAALSLFMCHTLAADREALDEDKSGLDSQSLWLLDMRKDCMGPEHRVWALGLGMNE